MAQNTQNTASCKGCSKGDCPAATQSESSLQLWESNGKIRSDYPANSTTTFVRHETLVGRKLVENFSDPFAQFLGLDLRKDILSKVRQDLMEHGVRLKLGIPELRAIGARHASKLEGKQGPETVEAAAWAELMRALDEAEPEYREIVESIRELERDLERQS